MIVDLDGEVVVGLKRVNIVTTPHTAFEDNGAHTLGIASRIPSANRLRVLIPNASSCSASRRRNSCRSKSDEGDLCRMLPSAS